jgi:hypothetical protein
MSKHARSSEPSSVKVTNGYDVAVTAIKYGVGGVATVIVVILTGAAPITLNLPDFFP